MIKASLITQGGPPALIMVTTAGEDNAHCREFGHFWHLTW